MRSRWRQREVQPVPPPDPTPHPRPGRSAESGRSPRLPLYTRDFHGLGSPGRPWGRGVPTGNFKMTGEMIRQHF